MSVAPDKIALAAPTGKAAQRLAGAVRTGLTSLAVRGGPDESLLLMRARTLHQLLDYQPSRDYFRRHAENPLETDVVTITTQFGPFAPGSAVNRVSVWSCNINPQTWTYDGRLVNSATGDCLDNANNDTVATILGAMAAACECECDGNIPITPGDVGDKIDLVERQINFG